MSTLIPTSMLAVQFDAVGAPPVARQTQVPRPGRGEVLLRMAASPINPSDIAYISGGVETRASYPLIPGFEGSGTVVAAGPGVLPRLWLGRRVLAGAPSGGAWAEYMVAAAGRCFPLGRNVSLEQGAMLLVNPMTALSLIERATTDKHKAIVSTAASGALGTMILRLAQRRRVEVINIVRRPEQAEVLRALGATYVLDSTGSHFQDQLRALAQRLNATLVLDAVGGELASQLVEAAPFGSTIVLYGNLSHQPSHFDPRQLIVGEKQLMGFSLRNWMATRSLFNVVRDFRTVQRLANGPLASKVQHCFPLSKIHDALAASAHDATSGKVLLVADPGAVRLGPR